MIIGHRDSESFVYHYTKMSRAKEDILPKGSLMIGRYVNTDDPKEKKDWNFTLWAERPETLIDSSSIKLSLKFSNALKERTKVVCFCRDRETLTGDHLHDIGRRGFAKPRMWSHRGGGHSGVCLVFDKKELHEQIRSQLLATARILAGPVSYADRHVAFSNDEPAFTINVDRLESMGFDHYVEMHVHSFGGQLFFEKAFDWRDESEFRFVVFSNTMKDVFINYGNSLKAVVFGESAASEDVDAVLRLLPLSVEVIGLTLKNEGLWYEFGNLTYNREFRRDQRLYSPT
jgi:hypothetical protein